MLREIDGIKIPKEYSGDAINSYKYDISKSKKKEVRDWYRDIFPERCEKITCFKGNWIGRKFGTYYKAGSEFRLCLGIDWYLKFDKP
jgi:hypothetical protein